MYILHAYIYYNIHAHLQQLLMYATDKSTHFITNEINSDVSQSFT